MTRRDSQDFAENEAQQLHRHVCAAASRHAQGYRRGWTRAPQVAASLRACAKRRRRKAVSKTRCLCCAVDRSPAMARQEVGRRRHGRAGVDSDEDYDGDSDAARAAGRAEGAGSGGNGARQQSSPHIGVTKVWLAKTGVDHMLPGSTVLSVNCTFALAQYDTGLPAMHNDLLLWAQVQEDRKMGGSHMAEPRLGAREPEKRAAGAPWVVQ